MAAGTQKKRFGRWLPFAGNLLPQIREQTVLRWLVRGVVADRIPSSQGGEGLFGSVFRVSRRNFRRTLKREKHVKTGVKALLGGSAGRNFWHQPLLAFDKNSGDGYIYGFGGRNAMPRGQSWTGDTFLGGPYGRLLNASPV